MDDLKTLSLDQLRSLQNRIETEIRKREAKERLEARRQILEIAGKHEINLADLAHRERHYRNPDNPWQFWNGRGRKPKWVNAWLATGRKLEDLETS
jgi:DNA-binding protein H-NS